MRFIIFLMIFIFNNHSIKFENFLVLAPLAYIIHHTEEHIIFNFREWRLTYFLDNNSLSTEEVLLRLLAVMLVFIFLHSIKRNKGSAHILLFFLMTTQVVNPFFHVFFRSKFQTSKIRRWRHFGANLVPK